MILADDVLNFWFHEVSARQWWEKSAQFDELIRMRFGGLLARAVQCELFDWRATPGGRLAEIIVLDQFSRNIHRESASAFAGDGIALALAQEAVSTGADHKLPAERRAFMYLPYMHSESAAVHEIAVKLFAAPGLEDNYKFELKHKAIIDQFGRYPHRNAALGRESTPQELAFLQTPGSSF